jgi:hypothetical protein
VLTTHPSSIEVQYRYSTVPAGRIKVQPVGESETVEGIELAQVRLCSDQRPGRRDF